MQGNLWIRSKLGQLFALLYAYGKIIGVKMVFVKDKLCYIF